MTVINRKKSESRVGRVFLAVCSTASFAFAASALTTAHAAAFYHYYQTNVRVNGSTVSAPGHITEKDPFGGADAAVTSFLPIWYIDQALGKFNAKVSWDGQGHLNIATPSSMTVNYPSAPKAVALNSATMVIEINGKPVTYAPRISYYDEGSGGIITTFVPVYYIEKILGYMGVTTGWDGTNWTMQYGSTVVTPPSTGETVKAAAAIAFAKAVGIQPDSSGVNPYSDVSAADWPYIHALTKPYVYTAQNGGQFPANTPLFQPSSGSTFGSDVTAGDIDRALEISSGLTPGHDSYLPNGSITGFGDALGLNKGVSDSGNLSNSDVATVMSNLSTIERGYISLGNNKYQLVYRPSVRPNYWTASVPAATYAKDWANAISVINKTTVTVSGSYIITQIPGFSDAGWASTTGNYIDVTGGGVTEQYSVNGGTTWRTTSSTGYDSLDPANGGQSSAPFSVLIKDSPSNGGGVVVGYDYDGGLWSFGSGGMWIGANGQLVVNYQ